LVRLSILQPGDQEATPLLCPVIPNLSSFGLTIQPPPAVFLQASYEGEAQMIRLVAEHVGPNNSVIDLFCGAGTLSAGLLEKGIQLKAIDLDGPAITAFEQAAHRAGYGQNTAFERRNLFAAPLRVDELTGADIVIIDPPRQGAEAQMHHLKNASIQRIIMVSCNPRSFSRDLAILTEAGKYSLEQITLIDQFIYSTHIELVGELTLSSDGK